MNPLKWPLILSCCGFILCTSLIADAQQKPDKRLLQKVSVEWDAKPIEDALKDLCEKHKLPVEFDASFKDDGHEGAPISLTADGITLGSVIHLVCTSNHLVSTIEKGKLLILTEAADEKNLILREYSLAALGGNINPQLFAFNLIGLTSGHWMVIDQEGGEVVEITPQSMSVRQTRTVHEEIQTVFDQLAGKAKAATPQERAEQLVLRKLQTPALPPADVTTLPEIFDQLIKKNGVPYWVDVASLKEANIDWKNLTSTLDTKKVATTKRLDAIAAEHKLSWRYDDEVIQVTSAEKADERMSIRVYDVRKKVGPEFTVTVLMLNLISDKDLGPWQAKDGSGAGIMPFGNNLVIRHDGEGHAKIAKLLK
ncbi:MAG: hypothetical protein JWP89_1835 [Schlesneria sp.]|nr:hypothetical protein [Schlesneria sp.]